MILSVTSPEIRAALEEVFASFTKMESNYGRWHPDHVLFRWLDPPTLKPEVRFYLEERIAGKLLKKMVVFTHIEPGSLIDFAPTSRLLAYSCRASRSRSDRRTVVQVVLLRFV